MIFNKNLYLFFPSRLWKLAFFCLLSLVILFQGLSLYIALSLKKPSGLLHHSEYKAATKPIDLSIIQGQQENSNEILAAIFEDIELKAVSIRPDRLVEKKGVIFLKKAQEELLISNEEPLFVYFDEIGCMHLTPKKISSPLALVPHISNKEVILKIENNLKTDSSHNLKLEKHLVLKPKGDDQKYQHLKDKFSRIQVSLPDLFLKTYGDPAQNKIRISLHDQQAILDVKNQIYYDGKFFTHSASLDHYLIQVKSINPQKLAITCFDPSGFYAIQLTQDVKPKEKVSIPTVDPPKQVSIRGVDSISCIFSGKKTSMKKGDFFIREGNIWKKIVSLEEFNALIEYKLLNEILVIEEIHPEEKVMIISGKIFDQSRWNFSSFTWKIEFKKEKKSKEVTKAPSVTPRSQEPSDMQDKNESEDIF